MEIENKSRHVRNVAASLYKAEDGIESSITALCAMMDPLTKLRSSKGITIFHGQDIIELIPSLLTDLAQCRKKIAELHKALHAGHDQLGIGPLAFGPVGKPTSSMPAEVTANIAA